jgi:lysophospholipase L1-like esterase
MKRKIGNELTIDRSLNQTIHLSERGEFRSINRVINGLSRQVAGSGGSSGPQIYYPVSHLGRGNSAGTAFAQGYTTATSATYRFGHRILVETNSIRLVHTNTKSWLTADADVTIRARIEDGANFIPVTWDGASTRLMTAGDADVISDPITVYKAAGSTLWTRTQPITASNGRWPLLSPSMLEANQSPELGGLPSRGGWIDGTTDNTATATASFVTPNAFGYLASSILGVPTAPIRCVGWIGDSITSGQGASRATSGYGPQACFLQGIPNINSAINGLQMVGYMAPNIGAIMPYLSLAPDIILNGGRNDFSTQTAANIINAAKTIAAAIKAAGRRPHVCTVTPITTSTDGFTTTANQTISDATAETRRVEYNTWVRDVAVQDGFFDSAIDFTSSLESSLNSGKWRVDVGAVTADGTHPNNNGHTTAANHPAMDLSHLQLVG